MAETVTLTCVTPEDAQAVVAEWERSDVNHTVVADDGSLDVEIRYFDKRFPLDVAEWAFHNEHAYDGDAAAVIGAL